MEQNTATIIELMREEAARHKQIAETLEAAALTLEKLGIAIPTPGFPVGGIITPRGVFEQVLPGNGNGHPAAAPAGKVGYKKPNFGITDAIEKLITSRFLDRRFFTYDVISSYLLEKYPALTKNTFHSAISYLEKSGKYKVQRKSAGGRDRAYLFTTEEHEPSLLGAVPVPTTAPAPDADIKQPETVALPLEETLYSGASL